MSDDDHDDNPDDEAPAGAEVATLDGYIEHMLPSVHVFGPTFPKEGFGQLATFLANQQAELNEQVIPEMMDPDSRYPCIELIVGKGEPGSGKEAVFPAYKQIVTVADPCLVFPMPLMYAILTSPVARAIFYLNGWQVRFRQRPDNPMDNKPRILI